MTKEELCSLTIEKLNSMTEEQLGIIANQVIELLDEVEIEQLPKDVRNKLKISREGCWGSWNTSIALIISALVMSLMQLVMGKKELIKVKMSLQ